MTNLGSTMAGSLMQSGAWSRVKSPGSRVPVSPPQNLRTGANENFAPAPTESRVSDWPSINFGIANAPLVPNQQVRSPSGILGNVSACKNSLELDIYGYASFSKRNLPVGNYCDVDPFPVIPPSYSLDPFIQADQRIVEDPQCGLLYNNPDVACASTTLGMAGLLGYEQADSSNDGRFMDFQATHLDGQEFREPQQQDNWMSNFNQSVSLSGHEDINTSSALGVTNFEERPMLNKAFENHEFKNDFLPEMNQGGPSLSAMSDLLLFLREGTQLSPARAYCPWSGCTETFARASDINRRYESIHLGIKHHCFWPGCPNNRVQATVVLRS